MYTNYSTGATEFLQVQLENLLEEQIEATDTRQYSCSTDFSKIAIHEKESRSVVNRLTASTCFVDSITISILLNYLLNQNIILFLCCSRSVLFSFCLRF